MTDATRATRETHRALADLVAEQGELDVVHRRWECKPDIRDRLVETLDTVGVIGGAGALARVHDRTLLVRYGDDDGWSDAGASLEPGESFAACAERAVEAASTVRCSVTDVLQVHVLYATDWTDRPPVPHPFVLFDAQVEDGAAMAVGDATEVSWFADAPANLRYEELRDVF